MQNTLGEELYVYRLTFEECGHSQPTGEMSARMGDQLQKSVGGQQPCDRCAYRPTHDRHGRPYRYRTALKQVKRTIASVAPWTW
jgi:hypothetical protein